ncbi:MAG: hypothetical protein AAF513_17775 [Pseudomonadota bacterium]
MTWLILFLVAALVIGPIAYLLPSAKDKRLGALRLHARQLGLSVKLVSLPKLDPQPQERVNASGRPLEPKRSCVAYQLPAAHDLELTDEVVWVAIPSLPTVVYEEVAPGWASAQLPAPSEAARANLQKLAVVPKQALADCLRSDLLEIIGFGISARFVALYWSEKGSAETGEVEEIKHILDKISDLLPGKTADTTE